jgi:hypothetical protein
VPVIQTYKFSWLKIAPREFRIAIKASAFALWLRHMRQATIPTEYVLPNQEQTLLLLTFMQNTAKVVQFKLDLTLVGLVTLPAK